MSNIEWTDETWNPTTGCDRVSPGCDNCYALTMSARLKSMGQAKYQTDGRPETSGPGFGVQIHPDTLDAPLKWRKPRRVFVNSMSDLFHPQVPDEFIARVFATMAVTPRHTYQVLTKRPVRMRTMLARWQERDLPLVAEIVRTGRGERWSGAYPLPNVWLGTSVEDQERADQRIPYLLATPAAVRFLSCEPLLSPVNVLDACDFNPSGALDWIIVGGESGKGARPMRPEWVRDLLDQSRVLGAAFFFKQWGGIRPKAGGRELDGRVWDEFPEVAPA